MYWFCVSNFARCILWRCHKMKKNYILMMSLAALTAVGLGSSFISSVAAQESSNQIAVSPQAISKYLYQTRFYSYSEYNINIRSHFFRRFPNSIYFNNGMYHGSLYIDSWETGPYGYTVTYGGYVSTLAPFAPLKEAVEK